MTLQKNFLDNKFVYRLWAIIMGVLLGIVVYVFFVYPALLSSPLINTNKSLEISYQQIDNSLLIQMTTGYWIWFDGKDALLYGQPTGRDCDDGYQSVFVIDISSGNKLGYMCATELTKVMGYYEKQPVNRIYTKDVGLDAIQIINLFLEKGIITV